MAKYLLNFDKGVIFSKFGHTAHTFSFGLAIFN